MTSYWIYHKRRHRNTWGRRHADRGRDWNISPPNRPFWHVDYFEWKALKKYQGQEGHWSCSFSWKQDIKLPYESVLLDPGGRKTFLSLKMGRVGGLWGELVTKICTNILVKLTLIFQGYFFTIYYPSYKPLCLVHLSQIHCVLVWKM